MMSDDEIPGMEPPTISQLASFLKATEDDLSCSMLSHAEISLYIAQLQKLIEHLMDRTFQAQNDDEKALLASLEMRARTCLKDFRRQASTLN